jgi:hypothetical protein
VRVARGDVYVDCGVASLVSTSAPALDAELDGIGSMPARGDWVSKLGAATGETEGIVVDADRVERIVRHGRAVDAPGQIILRGLTPQRPFSADGDSGAAVRNAHGEIVALLWGINARGESIACPIDVVLYVLHAVPVRLAAAGHREEPTLVPVR